MYFLTVDFGDSTTGRIDELSRNKILELFCIGRTSGNIYLEIKVLEVSLELPSRDQRIKNTSTPETYLAESL